MKFKDIREKYRSKFPTSLVAAAVKIALDMGGNMTGAYKKIEAMKRGLGDDPAVKDALRLANESVSEDFAPRALNSLGAKNYSMTFTKAQPKSLAKFLSMIKAQEKFGAGIKVKNVKKGVKGSTIVNFTSGSNLQITALQNALNKIMDQFNESFSNTQESLAALNEFATSMTYFDKKGAAKAEKLAKALKIYKGTKEVGKAPNFAYTVQVDGEFDQIEKWSRLI